MVLAETRNRRSSSLVRSSSNTHQDAGRFSPSLKAFKSACQRSLSMRSTDLKRPILTGKPITGPLLTNKALTLWSETVQSPVRRMCGSNEVKRQEAIFELIQSEKELVGDLLSLNLFYEKLRSASLLSSNELAIVFNCYAELSVCHQSLVSELMRERDENGRFGPIGLSVLNWAEELEKYKKYCPGLIHSKHLIDVRLQTSPQFVTILNECRSAVRSRLDLYSILDKPRARLAKYPLLIRNILKSTDPDHPDANNLLEAIKRFELLLQQVDRLTGDAQLEVVRKQLSTCLHDPVIKSATRLVFNGPLRTAKGVKVQAFLFDSGLVIAKPTTSSSSYNPEYRAIVAGFPADELVVEDIQLPAHFTFKTQSLHKTTSGSSLLRDIFSTASRPGDVAFAASRPDGGGHKAHAMFRVFTRPASEASRVDGRNMLGHRAGDGERIALMAYDDHAKRAWIDKLHAVARLHLTTF